MTGSELPPARAVAWDRRATLCADGSVVLGGAPWSVLRIAPAGRPFLRRLRDSGTPGVLPSSAVERSLAESLIARGVVHPVIATPPATADPPDTVDVVVPAYNDAESLEACLTALRAASPAVRVIVVDDGSTTGSVAAVATRHGAILLRHNLNRGPAAARNTGLREARAALVAFVDADCAVTPGWLQILAAHFADHRVAAVGPRIVPIPTPRPGSPLSRFEAAHSELDMGPHPQLVTPGGRLGYLPSAALLVRREALPADPFDERLRLGEDVDLVWRLIEAGHLVRYEPTALIGHRSRARLPQWAGRIVDYGTSAADLDRRHPGRLAPAQLSPWTIAVGALLLARLPSPRLAPAAAAATAGLAVLVRARGLRRAAVPRRVAPVVVARRLASDVDAAGHLLRREWWPIGWLALLAAPRSAVARAAAAAMLAAPARQWRTRRPHLDLLRYLALHLLADAAYGSGVILSAVRSRHPGVLLPRVGARRIRPG